MPSVLISARTFVPSTPTSTTSGPAPTLCPATCDLRQATPPLRASVSLSVGEVRASTFHSDARMSTRTYSHFLPRKSRGWGVRHRTPGTGKTGGEWRQPQFGGWKANEQIVKDLAGKKERNFPKPALGQPKLSDLQGRIPKGHERVAPAASEVGQGRRGLRGVFESLSRTLAGPGPGLEAHPLERAK